jgi:hypothetical protein
LNGNTLFENTGRIAWWMKSWMPVRRCPMGMRPTPSSISVNVIDVM